MGQPTRVWKTGHKMIEGLTPEQRLEIVIGAIEACELSLKDLSTLIPIAAFLNTTDAQRSHRITWITTPEHMDPPKAVEVHEGLTTETKCVRIAHLKREKDGRRSHHAHLDTERITDKALYVTEWGRLLISECKYKRVEMASRNKHVSYFHHVVSSWKFHLAGPEELQTFLTPSVVVEILYSLHAMAVDRLRMEMGLLQSLQKRLLSIRKKMEALHILILRNR